MVPRTMVPCATTNHVITDKIAQWYFVQRRHYGPAFQDCHPLTVPAQSWITVPVWLPRLNPEAEMLGPVAGGRLTSEEPCGTSPAPATPHWGDANKSGVSNLNTGIYLKIISWRENKTPSILAKLGGKGSASKIASNETARLRGTRDLCLYAAFLTPETSLWRSGVSLII